MSIYYFLNGLIVLMIGLLGGFPFATAIRRQTEREVAWRVVHSGGSMGGIMLIALGAAVPLISMTLTVSKLIFWGFIISTYALVVAMVIAAITGERGVGDATGNRNTWWKIVYYSYGLGALLSVATTGGLIVVCIHQIIR